MIKDLRIQEFFFLPADKQPGKEQLPAAQQHYFEELVTDLLTSLYPATPAICRLYGLYSFAKVISGTQHAICQYPRCIPRCNNRSGRTFPTTTVESYDFRNRWITNRDETSRNVSGKGVALLYRTHRQPVLFPEENSAVEIDNKESRKSYANNAIGKLPRSLSEARDVESMQGGFSVTRYLSARSKAAIEPTACSKRNVPNVLKMVKVTVSSDILHPELYKWSNAGGMNWQQKKNYLPNTPQTKALLGIVKHITY